MQSEAERPNSAGRWLAPLLVFILAALVYSLYGFQEKMVVDSAMIMYGGQRMAEGTPPYVSTFDNKAPFSSMLAGGGVIVSKILGWDDISTVRLVFLVFGALAVVAVYLLARSLFGNSRLGIFAATTFLGFVPFAGSAASGPQPKTPMVLFVTLSLLFTSQRSWFWAGLFGCLSSLTWMPTGIFPLITLMMAALASERARLDALARTLAGISAPILGVLAYFQYYAALPDLVESTVLFNIFYLDLGSASILANYLGPLMAIFSAYQAMALPIILGLIGIFYLYFWRRSLHSSFGMALRRDQFAPLLISFPLPVLGSLLDYRDPSDFYIFFPYISLGFALFLHLAVQGVSGPAPRFLSIALVIGLIAISGINGLRSQEYGLEKQRQGALEILKKYGEEVNLVSLGAPEVLVLLHRVSPTPYIVINFGVDQWIEDNHPGGFVGWLRELEEYNPEVIVLGRTIGNHVPQLMEWLQANYYGERAGPFNLLVRNGS